MEEPIEELEPEPNQTLAPPIPDWQPNAFHWKTALHEAGHVVVALQFGDTVSDAGIRENRSGWVNATSRPDDRSRENMGIRKVAGFAAEHFQDTCGFSLTDSDRNVFVETFKEVSRECERDDVTVSLSMACKAMKMLLSHHDLVEAIALHLYQHKTLSSLELQGIMDGLNFALPSRRPNYLISMPQPEKDAP